MRMLVLWAALCGFPASAMAFDHTHAQWTNVLKRYQDPKGLVKYAALKADVANDPKHPLAQYLGEIQAVPEKEYSGWTDPQKKAFLINAYNALTVKLIIDHHPVSGIKKIGGLFTKPWRVEFFSLLGGKIKSLDPIEHEWLRPTYKDFRIHAAVNCASISCPALRNEAFVAERLDAQLEEQMRAWLNDPTRNQIDPKGKSLKLSKIFSWYKEDFEKWGGGVVAVVNKYTKTPLPRELASQVDIEYLNYNWNLNESR